MKAPERAWWEGYSGLVFWSDIVLPFRPCVDTLLISYQATHWSLFQVRAGTGERILLGEPAVWEFAAPYVRWIMALYEAPAAVDWGELSYQPTFDASALPVPWPALPETRQ